MRLCSTSRLLYIYIRPYIYIYRFCGMCFRANDSATPVRVCRISGFTQSVDVGPEERVGEQPDTNVMPHRMNVVSKGSKRMAEAK